MSDPMPAAEKELEDALMDVIQQACWRDDVTPPSLDSMALSANADAMRLLARRGRLVIEKEYGRRVIGKWKEADDV